MFFVLFHSNIPLTVKNKSRSDFLKINNICILIQIYLGKGNLNKYMLYLISAHRIIFLGYFGKFSFIEFQYYYYYILVYLNLFPFF